MKPLVLVLPCYNEAKSLPNVVSRVLDCARSRSLSPEDFRLILVENGSQDESAHVMDELKNRPGGEYLQIVHLSPNQGYGHGVYQGLRAAAASRPGIVAWSHSDEQCDPEDVFKGWEIIRSGDGKTLVKGRRHGRDRSERFMSKVFEILVLIILGRSIHDINAQPKVFDSSLIDRAGNYPNGFAFDLYMLLKAKEARIGIQMISVKFPPRNHGESNWSATFNSKLRCISTMLLFLLRYRFGIKQ